MATVIRKDQRDWAATRAGTIGEQLLRSGRLREADVERILTAQRENGLRFGEAAIALGLIEEADVQRALARQFDHAHVDADQSSFNRALFAAHESAGPRVEALRRLRSELKVRCFRDSQRPLALFSARGGEVSALAANLALAFSQSNERTLLIDANLRSARQRELFALPAREGLTNVLAGRLPLADALTPVPGFPHLSVLCAGAPVPNPQELLSRGNLASLMEVAQVSFETVIVDCPPALEYADAQLIAAHCGHCLVVAERDTTKLRDLEDVKIQIEPTGAKLAGAVLMQA